MTIYHFDEMLNLNENEKPISQYDKKPYIDSMDKPVQVLNSVGLNTATLNRPNFMLVKLVHQDGGSHS